MAMIQRGTIYPVKTIIAKDLDAAATFNADINPAPPVLIPAGRFMVYNEASKHMTPFTGTYDATGGATIAGILAQDTDSTPITGDTGQNTPKRVGMIYRKGTFLFQEIADANNGPAMKNEAFLNQLRIKGIFFEWSWEGYAGIERPPVDTVIP